MGPLARMQTWVPADLTLTSPTTYNNAGSNDAQCNTEESPFLKVEPCNLFFYWVVRDPSTSSLEYTTKISTT